MKKALLAVAALTCMGTAAFAGPNAGGTLILALSEGTVYSPDINYCGAGTAGSCDQAVARADGTSADALAVINCLAAFPGAGRLAGVAFGVYYDPNAVVVGDYGGCGDFELPDGDWPADGSGTAVTWGAAQTTSLVDVYWFAAYGYDGYTLSVGAHPTQGGNFADDDVPSTLDPIAGFGVFGFGMDGDAPCPATPEPEACCLQDGSCIMVLAGDCEAQGGTAQGPGSVCTPDLCALPTGACCLPDFTCIEIDAAGCADRGGDYQGDGVACTPDLCTPVPVINGSWGALKSNYR
ncbi:MAG: hypothetical protein KC729_01700 [Candidatus Eisenbacteria bacterium]|uniref:Disintegrin domain-containing protein n=1 Tax=Eiseniibacteriota bacterium TaxID=2212470 RepID=A0A956LY58_UNCEI|nr:hypothetical protein [Candidatus Eisenbacteria bacterium]